MIYLVLLFLFFSYRYAKPTANNHKFFAKNPTAFAPNLISCAAKLKRPPITGAAFSPNFVNASASLLVALAPFLIMVRAPITIVVIIPATDNSNHRDAAKAFFCPLFNSFEPRQVVALRFFFDHRLNGFTFRSFVTR